MTTASVRWRCRRGLLELDLALGRFLEDSYA
ncbi:MAG: succinate dehydrogenase assembly factor 2, partial [Acidiferrobacter sp.]